MADLSFLLNSKVDDVVLLECEAANCVGLVTACEREETKKFLRMLAVDLMM